MIRHAALAAAATAALALPALAETRCGWMANPTPGNWWLTDRDATWTLSTQGIEPTNGWLDLPPWDHGDEWVSINGSYGYGCACFEGTVDWGTEAVTRVTSVRPLPLSRCYNDPALPGQ